MRTIVRLPTYTFLSDVSPHCRNVLYSNAAYVDERQGVTGYESDPPVFIEVEEPKHLRKNTYKYWLSIFGQLSANQLTSHARFRQSNAKSALSAMAAAVADRNVRGASICSKYDSADPQLWRDLDWTFRLNILWKDELRFLKLKVREDALADWVEFRANDDELKATFRDVMSALRYADLVMRKGIPKTPEQIPGLYHPVDPNSLINAYEVDVVSRTLKFVSV